MSYADGMAAFNLEKPKKIPRTEYSLEMHYEYLQKLTGYNLSDEENINRNILKARQILFEKLNYGFIWNVCIGGDIFSSFHTSMGHAEYMEKGTDYNNHIFCPFKDTEDVFEFSFEEHYEIPKHPDIVKKYNDNLSMMNSLYPDVVNTTGVYVTLMSGLIEIFGWNMLLTALGEDPERFGKVADRYAKFIQPYFDALADCDCPVAKVHDDIVWTSGPFVNPKWYRKYIFPHYKDYFDPIKESGKKILFTSDGTYDMFFGDIAEAGADGFVLEPTNDLAYCAENYGKTHSIVGAADTRVLLSNNKEKIFEEVRRNTEIGKDCPGFFLAVGNHIPPNTPVSADEWYQEAYEKYSVR
ncbi:MAG: hypothetical protein KBT47_09140, partial [Armatimonadetes bacterium]|nr:hypothetical protein [Candidatus Hippobium faecium]